MQYKSILGGIVINQNQINNKENSFYKQLKISNKVIKVDFLVENNESEINIDIWQNPIDEFDVYLVDPSNRPTQTVSLASRKVKNIIEGTKIKGYFYPIDSDSLKRRINLKLKTDNFITTGTWQIVLIPKKIIDGAIDIYLTKENNELKYKTRVSPIRIGVNIVFEPGFEERLSKNITNYNFYKLSDDFGTLVFNDGDISQMKEIVSIPEVLRFEPLTWMEILGNITTSTSNGVNANEEIGVNFFKNNPNISLTGRGVAIAIVSSGIDYLHPDFIYPDGTSKILYLWDQTKEGSPPKGYYIGTEYTKEQINKAIAQKDASLSTDEEGYGTMSAGICAGLGNVNSQYKGVAEEAELIIIKIGKIDGYYNNAMVSVAYEYAYRKAYEDNIPLIIDNTVGTTSLAGVSSRTITSQPFYTRGLCIVSSAGNEFNAQTHASGVLISSEDIQDVELELAEDEAYLEIDVWLDKPDTARVSVVSPSGNESKVLDVADYNSTSSVFDYAATPYSINYIYPTITSGQQHTIILLRNVKKGIWKIRLRGDNITNGIYNMYLPNRALLKPGTIFRQSNPYSTITYPGNYDDTITVGAYNSKDNSLWQNSSRGPTVSGLLKPDLVAPGVDIIGSYPGGGYATITGTSAASDYTSGCAALFMQYVLVNDLYVDKAFTQLIRSYFRLGAIRLDNINYPNNNYGYGMLNIKSVFDQLT
ncbi:hypothetical protein CHL78_009345 [Romboutsia weinsteinii]|uniref:Peptidase S8/S53 domain-containing protein n=1 Tax=Romboutsia weinsteinii TaxID=2020949 RepID=A0A371J3P9_9FIRM|nr:S8 family serine peptidase [Romboutsia weinsteinii]RDY27410.1 hypothetical protein CHL78_009345 [Romboutsia weinsteinii]